MDLRLLTGKPIKGRSVKVRCINPQHADNTASMAIYEDGLICFACGYQRQKYEDAYAALVKAGFSIGVVDDHNTKTRTRTVQRVQQQQPVPTALVEAYVALLTSRHRQWLEDRGIHDNIQRSFALGHTGSAYTFPVRDGARYSTIRFRTDDDFFERKQYWGMAGRNKPTLYGTTEQPRLVITEGEIDTLVALSHGFPAVTITNGSRNLKGIVNLLGKWTGRLVLCGDSDSPGLKAQKELALEALATGRINISACRMRHKDISEVYQEEGAQAVRDVISSAVPLWCAEEVHEFFSRTR